MHEETAAPGQVVKHATASVFVLNRSPAGWRLGLIEHPRFGRLMMPGGHVEAGESQAEAAVREVAEETGLPVRLAEPPAPPLPTGYRPPRVAQPWWIVEYQVPPDGQLAARHVHVDHLYVAVADDPRPVSEAAHPFGWYGLADLAGLHMFEDARVLATAVLAGLEASTPAGAGPDGADPDGGLTAAILARLPR